MSEQVDPNDFIISRKRKLYRFALFSNSPYCFETEEWKKEPFVSVLELGAGTGLLSVALAQNEPQAQVVAVDVKADRLQVGATLTAELSLSNVRFLRARVGQLPALLPPHSLQKIWVTFPDPLPKKRAAKNRLTHATFLSLYHGLLAAEGSLYMKTDVADLFAWSLEQLVEAGWHIAELSFDLHESGLPDEYKFKTTYESRYLNAGLPIHFVRATPPDTREA